MLSYKFTSQALADLIEIREYSQSHWGSKQSDTYSQQIETALHLLSEFPDLGRVYSELDNSFRGYSVSSQIIFYRVNKNILVVHGILHQRMLPHRILTDSKENK
ncbi:type II toxin-antitoxin system RelE/ParE family toxin [Pseudidiomarina donghaiensis]|uniref:Toxin n=1 Tax=Pseudidiomarina donghaiensis TaxID=519452 RepID=A0A432XKE4_9GAMM|nr:type II toxin-antitoxin system RelE/ParE family toxin [Pseudidiomarina donghaiensis]SFV20738.1 toxin ParE1/3/4 [Pseudidiomarina donghaiensis]